MIAAYLGHLAMLVAILALAVVVAYLGADTLAAAKLGLLP